MVRSFTPEFEVTWADPEDANHVWAIDRCIAGESPKRGDGRGRSGPSAVCRFI